MDILITNGTIIDGTGRKAYRADVAIKDGRVKRTGRLTKLKAAKTINADGLVLAPGFVDILNHSDSYLTLFSVPHFESMLRQGVTTILIGNCGSSLAPLIDSGSLLSIQKWADVSETNVNWLKMGEFLDELSRKPVSLNIATLVGHATIRRAIAGEEFRELTREELGRMRFMVDESLAEGAFGLSTGLAYSHAKVATERELEDLMRVLKKHKGLYATHLRDEASDFLHALNETTNLVRESGVSCEISHFKNIDQNAKELFTKGIEMVDSARSHGLDINFDVYPYLTIGSVLYLFLPDWASRGGKKMLLKRLKEPSLRERIIREMREDPYNYRNVIIASSPHKKIFTGKSIAEIAENEEVGPEEAILNALVASDGRIVAFMDLIDHENLTMAMRNNNSFIASDGFGYTASHARHGDLVHPRSFGAFPRFLGHYVRERHFISWEDAIRKISSGPAQKIGIKERGEIRKNYFADITIFDPNTIIDNATFKDPFQYPSGITHVIVNGELVVEDGELTGKMPGRILRRS